MVFDVLDHWPNAPDYEVIVVDDGSGDSTSQVVVDFQVHKPRLKLVRNGSQRGQSTCLAIAARHAVGKWLATLDADGQNDPADIPRLWSVALEIGCDAGLGWRESQSHCRIATV